MSSPRSDLDRQVREPFESRTAAQPFEQRAPREGLQLERARRGRRLEHELAALEARHAHAARGRLAERLLQRRADLLELQRSGTGQPEPREDARQLLQSERPQRLIGITTYAKPGSGRKTQAAV